MNRLFLIVLLFCGLVFSQNVVKTTPQFHGWTQLYNGTLSGRDTTTAKGIHGWSGVMTLAFKTDTTAAAVLVANRSDSCLTVGFQLYSADRDMAGWGKYYKSTTTYTLLDTIPRSLVNAAGNVYFMDVQSLAKANTNYLAWADSIRFIFFIGTGDSLKTVISLGGQ